MPMMNLADVAKAVSARWNSLVTGDYVPPACPTASLLTSLLETINYAAGFPEEGRYPSFNVTVASADEKVEKIWRFDHARPLSVVELRRLIPATDARKSAVHVEWDSDGLLSIAGVHDLGTSWHRARTGLEYQYAAPATLLIEVERPNRINIYQRQFRIATFSDGNADLEASLDLLVFLHGATRGGLEDLASRIREPEHEPPRDYKEFEFIALWNCYAAIANSIAMTGHGGAVIIVPSRVETESPFLRRKYAIHCTSLSDALVDFMNARHEVCDQYYLRDVGEEVRDDLLARLDWKVKRAFDDLVENIRLVAQLAQCDGALVLSRSLEVLGFGCEIAAELRAGTVVCEVLKELGREHRELDVEQFGMRHRSALKLASQLRDAVVLVVSQDGPISGVWADAERVYLRRGVRLVNANLPWA